MTTRVSSSDATVSDLRSAQIPSWLLTLAVVMVATAIGAAGASSLGPLIVAFAIGLLALWMVPARALLAIATGLLFLVPWGYLGLPISFGRGLIPPIVVMTVFFVRTLSFRRQQVFVFSGFAITAVIAWSLVAMTWTIDLPRSLTWTGGLAIVALTLLRSEVITPRMRWLVERTWYSCAVFIGALADAEASLGHSLFGLLSYTGDDALLVGQHWSVFRVTTTLGHPLMNGTFFAATAAHSFLRLLQRRSPLVIATLLASGVGMVLTVSRSATVALVLGIAAGLLTTLFTRSFSTRGRVGGIALIAVAAPAVLLSPLLAQRDASAEAATSADYRGQLIGIALKLVTDDGYLGSGPGTGQIRMITGGYQLPMESSALSTVIGLGVPGAALFAIFFVAILWRMARRAEAAGIGAIVGFVAGASGWTMWDSLPSASWMFLSLILMISLGPVERSTARDDPDRSVKTASGLPQVL